MHSVEIVLIMLLAVVASGYLMRMLPFSLPAPLVQIAAGAVIAGVLDEGVQLDPNMFFLLFLPPLLFLDGWRIPKDGLVGDRRVILQMAFGLVVFTVIGAGLFRYWMIPTMPLAVAFALAAIVSPTDPVAVSSIVKRTPMPNRLMRILQGESLFNDASGLVCFRFAIAAVATGTFSLFDASFTFLWLAVGGVCTGIAFTWGVIGAQGWLSRRLGQESGSAILINLLLPFGAYLVAEHLNASGILAAVAAGITMSYYEMSGLAMATTRVQRTAVWDTVQFALNGIMFVLLGEQLPGIMQSASSSLGQTGRTEWWWLLVYALAFNAGLVALRFAWVTLSLKLSRWQESRHGLPAGPPVSLRLVAATSLAGVRGAITMAGVMTIPLLLPGGEPFPMRELTIFLASSVILLSLLTASIGLPQVLRGLKLPPDVGPQQETELARREAARAAIKAVGEAAHTLPKTPEDTDLYAHAATRVMSLYERYDEQGVESKDLQRADQATHELRLVGLRAERDAIYKLVHEHRVSDVVGRKLVRELDLTEERYR